MATRTLQLRLGFRLGLKHTRYSPDTSFLYSRPTFDARLGFRGEENYMSVLERLSCLRAFLFLVIEDQR
ncbi:hypothetical protein SDJN03_21442, partial [Cucurbita argyrosperma subsp. sororia]